MTPPRRGGNGSGNLDPTAGGTNQGAGGGGSKGANGDYNQPGAGGGYAKKLLDVSSISTSTITV